MSTILDALRKLQREKAAANPPRDLRGSVTDEIPLGRAARKSSNGRTLAIGLVALLVALVAGGAWLWKSGMFSRPAAGGVAAVPPAPAPADVAQAASDSSDSDDDHVATEEELDQVEREALAAEQANEAAADRATAAEPEPPAAVAAPPVAQNAPEPPAPEPDPSVDPAAEARAERERLEQVQAAAAAAANAQREAEAQAAAARALPPAPPAPAVPVPPPAAAPTVDSRAAMAQSVTPPPVTPAPKAAKPKAKPKPAAPKAETARRETPRPASDSYDDAPGAAGATVFPPVRVESIRWHPIPERRVASLRFEQQNVSDAHEGDIVGGVLVYRIDPGAVEIRIGSTSRVVRPTP